MNRPTYSDLIITLDNYLDCIYAAFIYLAQAEVRGSSITSAEILETKPEVVIGIALWVVRFEQNSPEFTWTGERLDRARQIMLSFRNDDMLATVVSQIRCVIDMGTDDLIDKLLTGL